MSSASIPRRTVPLVMTGFFSSFINSGFKVWAVLALMAGSFDHFSSSAFWLYCFCVCILPSLIAAIFSGFAADRLPKRYIIIAGKFLELPLIAAGTFLMEKTHSGFGGYALLTVIMICGIITAFCKPALEGVLAETFAEPDLSKACGRTVSAATLGFVSGIAVMTAAFHFGISTPVMIASAICNICAAVKIVPVISSIQKERELAYSYKHLFPRAFNALWKRPGLRASALGEVCFTGLGITALPLLVLFSRYILHMDDALNIVILMALPGIGFMAGCFCAGTFSRNKIEPGLIPLGAIGMTIALALLVLFPGSGERFSLNYPGGSAEIIFYGGVWFWTLFAGFSGGILFIPMRSYILQRLRPEVRGAAIALKNAVSFSVASAAILLVIAISPGKTETAGLPPVLANIASVPFQVLLAGFGLLVFLCTLLALWRLPNFLLRFLILTVGHPFYRIRISGAENIPERGGALLLCNHVSAIDSILVSACTSRQIRFLLYDDYFSMPLLGTIARMTGFFKVPSGRKAKSLGILLKKIRSHLAAGGLICVFPEGKLTGNGLVGEFKHGYEKMLPPDVDIPIIPVNISFAWGNIFSNFFSRPGMRRKLRLPVFSAVSFGKPLAKNTPVFEIRQRIIELGADAAGNILPDEVTLHHAAVKYARKNLWKKHFSDCSGKEYSAFQLVSEAAALSRSIRRKLSSGETHVGILLPNSIEAFKAILAVLMADRVPVPLNYSTSQEVFDYSVNSAGVKMVISNKDFLKKIRVSPGEKAFFEEDAIRDVSLMKKWLIKAGLLLLPTGEFMNMLSPLTAFDMKHDAVLLFSSGSTGNPKGIRLSHHNLNSNARSVASAFAADENDLVVGNLPLFHSFGLNVCFWMPIMRRFSVTCIANPLDAGNVCRAIAEKKATMLFATPSFLQKYLRKASKKDLLSLRLIATGAEKLREDIAMKVRELTENRLEVVECYGCTELSPVVSINVAKNVADTGRYYGVHESIGTPLENISVRILDPLDFSPVEPGEEGIICVKGSLVMQGYLNDENATSAAMAGEYYKTGDIARMDESGYIHICGRLSRFSKIAGEMVPHEMVEKTINELCRCENRVVAVGSIPDAAKGEALLVLYTDEMPFTPEEIVDQLREQSISNLWIPKAKNFCKVDNLPLLGSGKLDLSTLREMAEKISAARQSEE